MLFIVLLVKLEDNGFCNAVSIGCQLKRYKCPRYYAHAHTYFSSFTFCFKCITGLYFATLLPVSVTNESDKKTHTIVY